MRETTWENEKDPERFVAACSATLAKRVVPHPAGCEANRLYGRRKGQRDARILSPSSR